MSIAPTQDRLQDHGKIGGMMMHDDETNALEYMYRIYVPRVAKSITFHW